MQWYFSNSGQRQGPISQADFEQFARDGRITADTLVWRQGMADWVPYRSLPTQMAAASTSPGDPAGAGDDTEVCCVSGKRFPRREMIQYEGKWISAERRDEFFQRLREGVALPATSVVPGPFGYGGFWVRFLARFLDGLILMVVGMMMGAVVGGIFGAMGTLGQGKTSALILLQVIIQVVNVAIAIAFEVFFVRKFDATPGKLALGLKILRATGDKLSTGRIIGRYFAQYLSAFTLLIGYIMAGFDEEKRSLHDRVCDTRVIKVK